MCSSLFYSIRERGKKKGRKSAFLDFRVPASVGMKVKSAAVQSISLSPPPHRLRLLATHQLMR